MLFLSKTFTAVSAEKLLQTQYLPLCIDHFFQVLKHFGIRTTLYLSKIFGIEFSIKSNCALVTLSILIIWFLGSSLEKLFIMNSHTKI